MTEDTVIPARYGALPLFLIAAVFAVLAPFFWKGVELQHATVSDTYESRDLYQYYYPVYDHAFKRYAAGDLPLWNEWQQNGHAIHVDPRAGIFQPLNAVFVFLATKQAMALHAFLCLFLMGAGTALFLRANDLKYEAALIGGVAFAFCGASAAGMSRPDTAGTLAWMPFVFWSVSAARVQGRRWPLLIGGVAGGFAVLAGSLMLAVALLALAAAYGVWVKPVSRDGRRWMWLRRFTDPGLLLGMAAAVSAVQWAPTLIWALHLADPGALLWGARFAGDAPAGGMDWIRQVAAASPGSVPRLAYAGIAAILFAPIAVFHRKRWTDAVFFGAAGAGLIGAALFTPWAFQEDPLRPVLIMASAFCVAVVAAVGADRMLSPRQGHRAQPLLLPLIALVAWAAVLFWAYPGSVRGYLVVALVPVLIFAMARTRWMAAAAGVLIAAVLFVDLATSNRNVYAHPYQDAPASFYRYSDEIDDAARQAAGGRATLSTRPFDPNLPANLGLLFPIHMAGGGYMPLTPHQVAWWQALGATAGDPATGAGASIQPGAAQPHLLHLMAVKVLLASADGPMYGGQWSNGGPALRNVNGGGSLRMYTLDDALPRAYWVPTAMPGSGSPADVQLLAPDRIDPNAVCVAVGDPAGDPIRPPGESVYTRRDASCSIESESPERIVLRVDAPEPGVTVLADSYAPGWIARINGERAPILRVNALFRGVATPAGPQEIEFIYQPIALYLAAAVSFVGIVVAVMACLFSPYFAGRVTQGREPSAA